MDSALASDRLQVASSTLPKSSQAIEYCVTGVFGAWTRIKYIALFNSFVSKTVS